MTSANMRQNPDYELPTEIPCRQLAEQVAFALRGERQVIENITYLLEIKVGDDEWKVIPSHLSLAELGVQNGAYLRVQRRFSTVEEETQLDGWRSLYEQKPSYQPPEYAEEETELRGYVWKLLE